VVKSSNGRDSNSSSYWKKIEKKKKSFDMDEDDEDAEQEHHFQDYNPDEDLRIEGTTIYLPPEVVMGAFPGPAADSWAMGCAFFQFLTGGQPILEEDEALAKNRIVCFDAEESKNENVGSLFSDSHASNVEPSARSLIIQLLNRHAGERPTMTQVAEHDFFQDAGVDIFSLHQRPAHPLDVGDVAPPPADAKWSRRQLSSIWAPQPQVYDISLDFEGKNKRVIGRQSLGPIPEGNEAPAFFSKSSILPSVRSQVVPLPPRR
jgi:serine/threonine protein kinase